MKIEVEIKRNPKQDVETQGKLLVLNESQAVLFNCDTLELANRNNAAHVSCIPCGVYICQKVAATKKIPYAHILVTNVHNRSGICIHIGNFAAGSKIDIEGCIIVGDKYLDINKDGIDDITNSRTTFLKLMSILPTEFKLTIK